MLEITYEEISKKDADGYLIADIRDEKSYAFGHLPGAVNIPRETLLSSDLPKDKEIFLCCRSGNVSREIAEELRERGYNAFSVSGGYFGWLGGNLGDLSGDEKAARVEESIRKKFHKKLFSKFAKAVVTYGMISEGDRIAVCISGGKDSMLMAKLFQELKRHGKISFEPVFLVMDPGYSPENRRVIELNAKMLGVPVTVFESDIFENVYNVPKSPCYLCARMRRGHLYAKARELGCNKIALGHHYDDVIETILMGMLYGGQVQTMMPKLRSTNFEGMELIRPMYLVREADIKAWRDYNSLRFIQCACKFTDTCTSESCLTSGNTGSKRKKVKELIASIAKEDPEIEQNIFKSVENVNLSTVIAYKDKDGERHLFTDEY
ncbi:MAG: ATPase [Clostridia bacterium]|nr:ATPase [Clostridia bacterium]